MMSLLLYLGLFAALTAAPLLIASLKLFRINSFSPVPRLTSSWVAAIIVLVISAMGTSSWRAYLGLEWLTWQSLGLAILAAVVMCLVFGTHRYLQGKLGKESPKLIRHYQNLMCLPFSHRCFVLATAVVTEEVLYRGYAIGVGQHLFGSLWLACIVSVGAFTLTHFGWGLAHLLPVFAAALVLTLLFTFTQNLWACIIAHALVDAIGFLVAPAIVARRRPGAAARAG